MHTYKTNTNAVIVFLAFIAMGFTFECFYGEKIRKQFLARSYTNKGKYNMNIYTIKSIFNFLKRIL